MNLRRWQKDDGFFVKDFTASELKLLKHLMRNGADVYDPKTLKPTGKRPSYFNKQFNLITID